MASTALCVFQLLVVFVAVYLTVFFIAWQQEMDFRVPEIKASPDGVLATFQSPCTKESSSCSDGSNGFFFAVATAPAHVEDQLNDSWLEFATTGGPNGTGRVPAWNSVPHPEQRVRFWSDIETELDVVAKTGAQVLRMGVDWGRVVTEEPSGGEQKVDWEAVAHYKVLFEHVRARGLRVMCTLFHHSFPKWGLPGGWKEEKAVRNFAMFADLVAKEFSPYVDYWITFNEPHLWVLLTHCLGVWPPGPPLHPLQTAFCMLPGSTFSQAMRLVARAHIQAAHAIRKHSKAPIGVAHNTAFMVSFSLLDALSRWITDWMTLFPWVDMVVEHVDFMGVNYYSQEFLSMAGLQHLGDEEFSEAGRAVYPDGLYRLLLSFHERYGRQHPHLHYIVTENGFADRDDVIRPAYMVEHLLAVHAAIRQGVPVSGYVWWTISDNWEWADGYCPTFGLAGVDRSSQNFTRLIRPSLYLFNEIASTGQLTAQQRSQHWESLQAARLAGKSKWLCRDVDDLGRMGAASLDQPIPVPISSRDWRLGHYKRVPHSVMVVRVLQLLKCWASDTAVVADWLYGYVSDVVFGKPHIQALVPDKGVDEL